nr:polyprotein [Amazon lily mosaic virus]
MATIINTTNNTTYATILCSGAKITCAPKTLVAARPKADLRMNRDSTVLDGWAQKYSIERDSRDRGETIDEFLDRMYAYNAAEILREELEIEKYYEEQLFKLSAPTPVTSISIAGGLAPSATVVVKPVKVLNKTPSARKRIVRKNVLLSQRQFNTLLKEIKNTALNCNLTVEVIDKKTTKVSYQRWHNREAARIQTLHSMGKIKRTDVNISQWSDKIISSLVRTDIWGKTIQTATLRKGDSGIALNPQRLCGPIGRYRNGYFIVRGNHEGKIYDSRSLVTMLTMLRMEHYSISSNFWKGYEKTYMDRRPVVEHACSTDFSVVDCGSVAAHVMQSIAPSYRMTCHTCVSQHTSLPKDELQERLHTDLLTTIREVSRRYSNFQDVLRSLQLVTTFIEPLTDGQESFNEIFTMIGDRQQSPFKHINALNEFLIRGKDNTVEQWKHAREHLLEIARFQKNRTDNIRKGDISAFRNKLSSKANYNLYLSCDNQLDKNANFIWGQREYHAKRFFSNFFEEIDPSKGYVQYEIRKFPNGARKLAIGNLIVPLDLAEFRQRMKGEYVQQPSVGKQCVSLKDGNFIYPCCCTTLDDGSAVESILYAPTKKHLVVGNSGDSKHVDLPKGDSEMLYIAKAGYCYINVFLAMLINVSEDDAKDFTKRVRDLCVPKLGEWPTLMDLATTCAQLRIFYPDVHDAELPRILIDHNTQTCHVVDSYGSITTGYHILKAATVSQLIMFANDELQSDIKHYRVGGRDEKQPSTSLTAHTTTTPPIAPSQHLTEVAALKLLLKGIYRPKVMEDLLQREPYIMLLSLLSPGIILAMFNNGSFEIATKMWISEKQSVAIIATMLANLARKISVAETVVQQMSIIERSASDFMIATCDGVQLNYSYLTAITLLQRLKEKKDCDYPLEHAGYLCNDKTTLELMEKSYLALLEEEWNALSWREKFSAMWHAQKQQKNIIKSLNPLGFADFKGMYDISPSACFTKLVTHCKSSVEYYFVRSRNFVDRKITTLAINCVRRTCKQLSSFYNMINCLFVISALLAIFATLQGIIEGNKKLKLIAWQTEVKQREQACEELHVNLTRKLGRDPTWLEFLEYTKQINPELGAFLEQNFDADLVVHQKATSEMKHLEQIVAFVALVLMVFDSEKSDCVFKTLNKFKGIIGSLNSTVQHQSLDDIVETFEDRNQVVNFDLKDDVFTGNNALEVRFGKWWNDQITLGHVKPHYRTEGKFLEFTRETAEKIASDVSHTHETDFLIRGAVGSGKSTSLPAHLSEFGKVLLIEPTRPLAENVHKQLSSQPFFLKPTLRMRGHSIFGSTPITVMTSGFALHFFAHNVLQLQELNFIIFDECHVMDASAMAFRCLLYAHHKNCKVIKTSATPPGREVEFTTQKPVKVIIEENLSFKNFVDAQGSGSNADMIKHGKNILVYVASYNEVDMLAKLLIEKNMMVTKVDGRTMKHGNLEIETKGTTAKPHFVVATNIIENGVSLDIDAVVDFGMKVSPALDVDNRSIAYNKVSVSYGERIQRLGRVGRVQKGAALRIGHTEKGLVEIPSIIATEAALCCFAYNLPVMTGNVSTSLLEHCTLRQVLTMHQFELSPFFMCNFVAHDGTMHPEIYNNLKMYKLRDSITPLSDIAIPYRLSSQWLSVQEYARIGVHVDLPQDYKVAFYMKDIPEKLHGTIWETVVKYKGISVFPTIKAASISKIAYTLSTDIYAIPRTLTIIDKLLEDERIKQQQFKSFLDNGCSSMFSIVGITNILRARYSQDYTSENIQKLEAVKNQLKEFQNIYEPNTNAALLQRYDSLQFVQHQSGQELAKAMRLKGIWRRKMLTRDIIVTSGVLIGGACMLYKWFVGEMTETHHQGKTKSKRIQALKFRKARDKRAGYEIDNNEDTIEEYFGSAYTKKGKGRGTTIGMGKSSRRFINMYGFEPGEFSYIRFVDPLTGAQIEENVYADIVDIQERFGEIRKQKILDDEIDSQQTLTNTTIHAYMIKDWSDKALKIDLTPHNPLKICDKHNTIAKFPEREFELRQTGMGVEVLVSDIPTAEVQHESRSLLRGLRDYNPIAQVICRLTAKSEHGVCSTYGIGFGALIIANHHLFKSFNGTLEVRSHHGLFKIPNMMSLQVRPIKGRDIIIIKLPKDFPIFPQRLHFREPQNSERVCIVGSNFQEKFVSSTITETSSTHIVQRSTFWKHWIATDDGHCGLPVVATSDGLIVGIHSLANNCNSENYYTAFDNAFEADYLRNTEHIEWVKNWKYNPDTVVWGPLKLSASTPSGMFKTTKLVEDLFNHFHDTVREQGANTMWMLESLKDNLQAVAYMKSQLVTKHVVKGECSYFQQFLEIDEQARDFFKPLMWAYDKSRLNQEAYIKDLMKYSKPIQVGVVDCDAFEEATCRVILYLKMKGFRKCTYITDEEDIFKALNMKSAVGAMYGGKKKEYFENFSQEDKEQIVKQSCFRLYSGKLGIWNGSLKAELRCKEKVQANKTRTFTAAPIDTLLGGKVCVDDFNNQFYSKNTECSWTVGMTKFYGGWNKLLDKLPDGWIYCDADGSQFDSSLTPYLINAVLSIRLAYMEEWDIGYQMLSNLYTEIIYTPISTPDGTVVKKFRGNNSGQPSTVVDNSLMVILAMHYAFVMEGIPLESMEEQCVFFVNGDDLLLAVHPNCESLLDNLGDHFQKLGLNYDFSSRSRNKSDMWFMSHRGISIDGVYIPKLEEERIVSILQWDRASLPEHRLEAICAAMIEAWGYPQLIHQIRRFYQWLISQEPFAELAQEGKAPYISELALRKLYLNKNVEQDELQEYLRLFTELDDEFECGTYDVYHQSSSNPEMFDTGLQDDSQKNKEKGKEKANGTPVEKRDRDINTGTSGTHTVPRIKSITSKMRLPKSKGKVVMSLDHLLKYTPSQTDISNTRATQNQFDNWYTSVKLAYDIEDDEMTTVLNGLMVWCIENGTSPNINGVWTMMDGEEQVEFPLKPVVENAKPTLRQIMAHFSDVAEAYIEMRNNKEPYMPRYGLIRNLRDMSLARYAFDFYEVTSRTPVRAREAHIQMKAAALKTAQSRMFGLDGGISTQEENTERHTTEDVSPNMHTLLGVRNM